MDSAKRTESDPGGKFSTDILHGIDKMPQFLATGRQSGKSPIEIAPKISVNLEAGIRRLRLFVRKKHPWQEAFAVATGLSVVATRSRINEPGTQKNRFCDCSGDIYENKGQIWRQVDCSGNLSENNEVVLRISDRRRYH